MRLSERLAAFLVALLPLCAAAELPPDVQEMLRAAAIPESAMSALVVRLSDGKVVLEHEGDRARQPASTLKILTSLVALDRLGPTWRGKTELRTQGEIVNGVLKGDLVLRGMADVDFDWVAFEQMLQVLRLKGVRDVRGDLVLDLGYFTPARSDVGVAPFDQWPEFRYNVIPDALMLNSNLVRLDMVSDGRELRVATTPPLHRVTVRTSDMKLVERRCADWEDGWILPVVERHGGALAIRLQGDFPQGCTAHTSISVIDRVEFAERLFRTLWTRLGGRFHGRAVEGKMSADATLVTTHSSRTLAEITRDVNKRSDNPITRVIFLALGATAPAGSTEAATIERSAREVRDWLARRGIDPAGIVLENGSGLSRVERISPRQLVEVLKAAAASEWAPEFMASLPIVATDGGMRNRLKEKPPAARGRIKTGTLRDVTAVAGYLRDEAGETYAVNAVINDPLATGNVARPIVDGLLEWVIRTPISLPETPR